jgi:hypothetical protein
MPNLNQSIAKSIMARNGQYFCIDVTFEIRTVSYRKAFIQLMALHAIRSFFISKQKRGQEGKIAERKREREGERTSVG